MHVIVLKYVQVLCITIFFSNNINCDKLLLHNEQEDQELYRIGACTARCLADRPDPASPPERMDTTGSAAEPQSIERCYTRCSEDRRPASAWRPLVQRQQPPLHINLICRDSTNLIVEVRATNGRVEQDEEEVDEQEEEEEEEEETATKKPIPSPGGVAGGHHPQGWPAAPDPARRRDIVAANVTAERVRVSAAARTKRAIGGVGGPGSATTDQRPKAGDTSAGNRGANMLPGERSTSKREPDGLASAPRAPRQPIIYLVKVQESEKELGDRIVYMNRATAAIGFMQNEIVALEQIKRSNHVGEEINPIRAMTPSPRDPMAPELPGILRQRSHVLAKVVRMQRQLIGNPPPGTARAKILAEMLASNYDEYVLYHNAVMARVAVSELDEQEQLYEQFETLYLELSVQLKEHLHAAKPTHGQERSNGTSLADATGASSCRS